MKSQKKLDVHLVEHTHWDREWYFTSDDSRTMLYYDMKFMIDHLLKNKDKFTYDGQSSIIDDFLMFSPKWKEKLKKVVREKKLYVGPFYTAVDDTAAAGESISRNLEMGRHIAKEIGHSMEVGYLPDTFGHNNQIPQILKMNGLSNFSFYRGLDPELVDDKLFFIYKAPDGSEVLAHWQTHYTTRGFSSKIEDDQFTEKWFTEKIIANYKKKGEFGPSVKSYEKRNFGLPIAIPIGTDQRPYSQKMPKITKKMNKKYPEYNFINSSYEDFIKAVANQIKSQKIKLKTFKEELRVAKTGRSHRTISSSRMDIKQLHFEFEQVLINILEPMTILCSKNNIDVPWEMVDEIWKHMHRSSAHDSYACSNEDHVNKKLKNRLTKGIRMARGLIAMLSRIYANKIISEEQDAYKKLIIFNYKHTNYNGSYQIMSTIKKGYEDGKFDILFNGKKIKYSILKRNDLGTHERDALLILLHDVSIKAFSHLVLDIKYDEKKKSYQNDKSNLISNGRCSIKVNKNNIIFSKGKKTYKNLIKVVIDASVGDTYDHSPITFNDKKYEISDFRIIETVKEMNTIKFKGIIKVPSGILDWTKNKPSINQDVQIQITILDDKFHIHIETINKSLNSRMLFLVESLSSSDRWYHDQQFGIYKREIVNKYMKNWDKKDSLGYKWDEYPTNLSPCQTFVSNNESNNTIYVQGTKEHELIEYQNKKYFSFTLYRASGKFGTSKVVYRPGRASGAKCDSPDSQLKDQLLEFDFIIDPSKKTLFQQFKNSEWMHLKNFYIPRQWALKRTILRWYTNINYYDKDNKNRSFDLDLDKSMLKEGIMTSSIYRRMNGDIIVRLLNVGNKKIIKPGQHKISRTLYNFKEENIELPSFGLINIWVGKK